MTRVLGMAVLILVIAHAQLWHPPMALNCFQYANGDWAVWERPPEPSWEIHAWKVNPSDTFWTTDTTRLMYFEIPDSVGPPIDSVHWEKNK